MSPSVEREAIFPMVRDILVEVLSLRPEAIREGATILLDLGAESIDLLDLRFRIERAFGFPITNDHLVAAFGPGVSPEEFRRRFTVQALCDYVQRRLEEPRA